MYQINAVYELVFDERDDFIILIIYMFKNFSKMKTLRYFMLIERIRYKMEVRNE